MKRIVKESNKKGVYRKRWTRNVEKKASSQTKWRRNKKEERQQSTISIPNVSTSRASDLRKKEGQRRRRLHLSSLRADNIKLRETVRILTKEIKQLRLSRTPTPPPDSPLKIVFDNVSPNAKQRTVLRPKDKIENLPRGTSAQIRSKFGINLSKQILPKTNFQSLIQTEIETFLCRDDITKLCPDKQKQIDGNQIRYRLNHLNILHQQFELEIGGHAYACHVLILNSKYEKLHQLKRKHARIEVIVDFTPIDLYDLAKDEIKINEFKDNLTKLDKEDEEILVTFCEWQKIKTANCTAPVSTKVSISISMKAFIEKFIIEVDVLTKHICRMREQFRAAKAAKEQAKENTQVATIQLDWGENYNLKQAREEKGAYYYEQHISIQSGFVWLNKNSFSFASISDDTCHMAEAAWAAIQNLLKDLINENNVNSINFISDSPISQYRNKTMIYLMKKLATDHHIDIKWIFLESGHGKGVVDAVGAAVKRKFDETVAFNPDNTFENALSLINV
ncbi:unnamed protein product [Rotaria magnacalcarata]|uniref:Uncharacterized protein n=2 Tax=Rotaria magnacalcarata TaxID=392030 RepID=A0A814GJN9_9BILA|nr:unnamed protein product [Rotaria magnacalcarata]CAF1459910.1 unnamed protein product [Rotaria magnacalcarata]CAF4554411.1 unnamed protein product [Rotaria magnacalcarata]CAF4784172.1 unnamed protein product [Rotaria magnacalcarata]